MHGKFKCAFTRRKGVLFHFICKYKTEYLICSVNIKADISFHIPQRQTCIQGTACHLFSQGSFIFIRIALCIR